MAAGQVLFYALGAACLLPAVPAWAALLGGMAFALGLGNPCAERARSMIPRLLAISVVGLGAGMDLGVIGEAGLSGFGYTIVGIVLTLAAGAGLGALLGVPRSTRVLVSAGTAICGGSAIAAMAAVLGTREEETSVSLATVFVLNAAALVAFPLIGLHFGMEPAQFGLWCALAIHDTSSVVGAALQFGPAAVDTATTVKLARTLWIIPLTLAAGLIWPAPVPVEGRRVAVKRPWFILYFLLAAALVTWAPALKPAGAVLAVAAKRLMILTLFLIGGGLSESALQKVGWRPFALGLSLWAIVGTATFLCIQRGWMRV